MHKKKHQINLISSFYFRIENTLLFALNQTIQNNHIIHTNLPSHDDWEPVSLSISFGLYSVELPISAALIIPVNDMVMPNWKVSIILIDAAKI